jgi:hypothetical protein
VGIYVVDHFEDQSLLALEVTFQNLIEGAVCDNARASEDTILRLQTLIRHRYIHKLIGLQKVFV